MPKKKQTQPETVIEAPPAQNQPSTAPEPAPAAKRRKGPRTEATANDASPDAATPVIETQAPTDAKAKKKRKQTVEGATLADCFAGYLRSLEEAGKSEGTVFSYRLELVVAGAELGADTKLVELTPKRVALFFDCGRVTQTRNGRPKSPLSIAKTQRVVRQALVWAEQNGMIAKAPLPEQVATH